MSKLVRTSWTSPRRSSAAKWLQCPAVTDTYVLFGVGAKADDGVFTRYEDGHSIELYNEAQLSDAYRRLDEKRTSLQSEIAALKIQSGRLKRRDRTKQSELQKQITAKQQELKSTDEIKRCSIGPTANLTVARNYFEITSRYRRWRRISGGALTTSRTRRTGRQ